ncbi:hypothetical protein PCANC_09003 [Puccinia coronata f. sp. avenae]|uniref:MICOS complex subunit MIC60 n=1 Tax=Puccinia coronata f. sp. avenae TaxID=200324 RepID=A0A2N5VHU3_9BASI|nr:hypothetical protein PCANC_09003 [Puccinia coronata f. sp. avenae]
MSNLLFFTLVTSGPASSPTPPPATSFPSSTRLPCSSTSKDLIAILNQVAVLVDLKDLNQATCLLTMLHGWPKFLAHDWLQASRRHLELHFCLSPAFLMLIFPCVWLLPCQVIKTKAKSQSLLA